MLLLLGSSSGTRRLRFVLKLFWSVVVAVEAAAETEERANAKTSRFSAGAAGVLVDILLLSVILIRNFLEVIVVAADDVFLVVVVLFI
jgi:hypothetical protein